MIETLKALADENRLRLLHLLSLEALCVCELEVILDMSQSNVSRHLNKLRTAGVISSVKEGLWVHYQISETFAQHSPELWAYLKKAWTEEKRFSADAARYEAYKGHGLSCRDIAEDRQVVNELIEKAY